MRWAVVTAASLRCVAAVLQEGGGGVLLLLLQVGVLLLLVVIDAHGGVFFGISIIMECAEADVRGCLKGLGGRLAAAPSRTTRLRRSYSIQTTIIVTCVGGVEVEVVGEWREAGGGGCVCTTAAR